MTTATPNAHGVAVAPCETFTFEQAENLRHYREVTVILDPDDAARVRALIAADDSAGMQAFLDAHLEQAEVREITPPVEHDDDAQRVPALLSVCDDTGERDLLWEA